MTFKKKATVVAAVQEIRNADVVAKAAVLTPESTTKKLVEASNAIQKKLAEVAVAIQDRFAESETLDAKIELQKGELLRLHGIEAATVKLDELEAKIAERAQEFHDQEKDTEEARAKETTEYEYSRDQERRAESDEYERDSRDDRERFERREAEVSKAEAELADLRLKVGGHDAALAKAAAAGEGKGRGLAKSDYDVEVKILKASHDADTKVWVNTHQSISGELARANERLKSLEAQLDKAHTDNILLAQTAVNAASYKPVADSLRDTLNTQATSTPPANRR